MSKGVDDLERAMSLPLDIRTDYWKRISGRVLQGACVLVFLLLGLAAFAPVKEVAVAEGQIVTERAPVAIEHLEGGIVAEVFVRQGDIIEAGAPVLRLSPQRAESDLDQVRTRNAFLQLQSDRISAQIESREPDFGAVADEFPELARDQMRLFRAELTAYQAELDAVVAEIRERELERDAASREVASASARIAIAEEQSAMQRRLLESGYATRTAVLDAESLLEADRSDLASAEKAEIAAVRAIADATARSASLRAKRIEQWTLTLAELSGEQAELADRARRHTDQVERLLVSTPVEGMVHEVTAQSRGEVISPGDRIATIVPLGDELLAEVKVLPQDIGHIEVGFPAEVTVTTFDREVYGFLAGTVVAISPTTFESPQEEPFYNVRLALEGNALELNGAEVALLPGMIVRSEILTGERSVLRYLLKPLVRAFDRAFIER